MNISTLPGLAKPIRFAAMPRSKANLIVFEFGKPIQHYKVSIAQLLATDAYMLVGKTYKVCSNAPQQCKPYSV